MLRFNVKLMRGSQYVTLQLLESRPLVKGTWKRVEDESNSMLMSEEGTWENWALGSPRGVRDIRLYDSSETIAAVLRDFLTGTSGGEGIIILPDFAGPFGDSDFRWAQISNVSAREPEDSSHTTGLSPLPESVSLSAAPAVR